MDARQRAFALPHGRGSRFRPRRDARRAARGAARDADPARRGLSGARRGRVGRASAARVAARPHRCGDGRDRTGRCARGHRIRAAVAERRLFTGPSARAAVSRDAGARPGPSLGRALGPLRRPGRGARLRPRAGLARSPRCAMGALEAGDPRLGRTKRWPRSRHAAGRAHGRRAPEGDLPYGQSLLRGRLARARRRRADRRIRPRPPGQAHLGRSISSLRSGGPGSSPRPASTPRSGPSAGPCPSATGAGSGSSRFTTAASTCAARRPRGTAWSPMSITSSSTPST